MPLLIMSLACAERPEGAESLARGGGTIHDAEGVFRAHGPGFRAEIVERDLDAGFDRAGVTLQVGEGALLLRTVRWGRGMLMRVIEPTDPAPARCVHAAPSAPCSPVLEYQTRGLTEWWIRAPGGFEQGWTLPEPPPGSGELRLELALDGAVVEANGPDLWLRGPDGTELRVRAPTAQDADQRPLPARFEAGYPGFSIVVDDSGARYPLRIDPVYTTPSVTLAPGGTRSVGWSVAPAGDVNGDGVADVLVGAPQAGSGVVYLFAGSEAGVVTAPLSTLRGEDGGDEFGAAVSGAGDVNGDGFDDVIVGARGHDQNRGRAYVFLGAADGLVTPAAVMMDGEDSPAFFAESVSGAGDINGDCFADVIVGSPDYNSTTGRAYLYAGSPAGVSSTPMTVITGEDASSSLGRSVSAAGDVNEDGYGDVLVGADMFNGFRGRVYLYLGSPEGIAETPESVLDGEAPDAIFGFAVSGAGDLNGDGPDDVVVGAPWAERAYVFYGPTLERRVTLESPVRTEGFGWSVADAGDVDGDGYDDIIVGTGTRSAAPYDGFAFVFPGSDAGVASAPDSTLASDAPEDRFGYAVAGAGDLNVDGYDDVVVGVPGGDSGEDHAEVYDGYGDAAPVQDGPSDPCASDSADDSGDPVESPSPDDTGGDGGERKCGCATGDTVGPAWILALALIRRRSLWR